MAVQSETLIVEARLERWPYASPFRISGYEWSEAELVYVEIERNGLRGRGECAGVYYHENDSPADCLAQIENMRDTLAGGAGRLDLMKIMPAGGARNAIDCALWDLEAKEQRRPVWQLAGLEKPQPVRTTYTIGADDPAVMAKARDRILRRNCIEVETHRHGRRRSARARGARRASRRVVGSRCEPRFHTRASRAACCRRSWKRTFRSSSSPSQSAAKRIWRDCTHLFRLQRTRARKRSRIFPQLVNRFHIVNIKLDKCGGLTEGLAMAARARELGLGVMVGNMMGTSIAMAPGFLVGQLCDVTDLDGPLLLRTDRKPSVEYRHGNLWCGEDVWGGAA